MTNYLLCLVSCHILNRRRLKTHVHDPPTQPEFFPFLAKGSDITSRVVTVSTFTNTPPPKKKWYEALDNAFFRRTFLNFTRVKYLFIFILEKFLAFTNGEDKDEIRKTFFFFFTMPALVGMRWYQWRQSKIWKRKSILKKKIRKLNI